MTPLGLNQSRGLRLLLRQRRAQTHVRPGKVVEGLKEDDTPPHLGAILTETLAFSHRRGQGMTQRKIETFDQTGANPEDDGTVIIYWGAADTVLCVGTASVADLVDLCLTRSRAPV